MRDFFLGSYHPLYPEEDSLHKRLKEGQALRRKVRKELKPATTITTENLQMRLDASDAQVVDTPRPVYGGRVISDDERKLQEPSEKTS